MAISWANGRFLGKTAVSWAKWLFLGRSGCLLSAPRHKNFFGSKQPFWGQNMCFDTKTGGCEIYVGLSVGVKTVFLNGRFLGETGVKFWLPDTKNFFGPKQVRGHFCWSLRGGQNVFVKRPFLGRNGRLISAPQKNVFQLSC
jgi:hypothetical protein